MTATTAREQRASASDNLRLEPTALPTRLCRTRTGLLGWHPIALPVVARG